MHQIAPQGTPIGIWNFETSLLNDQCFHIGCNQAHWCSKQLLTQHRLLCKLSGQCFQAESLLISHASSGPPAGLILQDQNTSFWTMSKGTKQNASCKHWWLKHSEFKSVFKRHQRKCYNMLYHTFQHDCRSAMNNTVVTYEVSHSNINDEHEFSCTWNVGISVNTFLLCLKMLFNFKNSAEVPAHNVSTTISHTNQTAIKLTIK